MQPVVGVDLGGTKLLAGVVDERLDVLERVLRPSDVGDEDDIVEALLEAVGQAIEAVPEVAAIGVGVPCTIDQRRGVAVAAVNLPLTDVPLRDILAKRFGLPSFIDNDANVAGLAEVRHGAAQGLDHVIMLTVGTGIGGAIVLDGELYHGSVGAAGELGHMVVSASGPRCQGNCPNRGCLEAMASGTALARAGRAAAEREPDSALGKAAAGGTEIRGRLVTEEAIAGDEAARAALAEIGAWLGIGIANYINIFNPEAVIVGGGVIAAGDLLLEPAREEVLARALQPGRDLVQILPAHFGADAGLLGAATLARDELHRQGAG